MSAPDVRGTMVSKKPGLQVWKLCALILLVSPLVSASQLEGIERQFETYLMGRLAKVQGDSDQLMPFTTDGCSGGLSEGWRAFARILPGFKAQYGEKPPWENCCVEHDRVYWQGEAADGYAKRKAADLALKQCVRETGVQFKSRLATEYQLHESTVEDGFKVASELMYSAVRVAGGPCTTLPWRWGYGWPMCPIIGQGSDLE